ncbi:hypothetical protein OIU35_30605 [Boseaceae bacterium BT-24-1]|nr:hypothetical protein [Boseaceae bacterium BT-24-1]
MGLVIFTTRRETQTTIQNFLEASGLRAGLINGDSRQRDQETIARFKQGLPRDRFDRIRIGGHQPSVRKCAGRL